MLFKGYGAKVGLGNMRVKAENRMLTPNQMAPNLKGVKDDIQYKAILAKELSVLENAIKEQEKYNRRRAILFSFSFALIIAGIIASSVIFLISTIC